METFKFQTIEFHVVVDICNYITSLINQVFKSNGSSALIINEISEIAVTKSGIKILEQIQWCHPIAKFIVSAIKNYHQQTGDGVKTFLLLLQKIIDVLDKEMQLEQNLTEFKLNCIGEIFSLVKNIPTTFVKLRSAPIANRLLLLQDENCESHFKQIIGSYFLTKFSSSTTAKQLSSLMCQFIAKSITNDSISKSLNYLVANFPLFISKSISSTEHSRIIEGFVFSKTVSMSIYKEKCNFVVLENIFDKDSFDGITFKIDTQTNIDLLINFSLKRFLEIMDFCKKNKIHLILTSELATREFKYICQSHHVMLLDGILTEELDFFCCHLNVIPLNIWDSNIDISHIGHAKLAKTIILNSIAYLQLIVDSSTQIVVLQHIIICSTIKALSDEYFNECYHCIKLLSLFMLDSSISNSEEFNKGKVIGIACPFSAWAKELSVVLKSVPYSKISPLSLKISFAIKDIIDDKFSSNDSMLYLEPVIRHEILFSNVLYLVIQLLKVDSVIEINKS